MNSLLTLTLQEDVLGGLSRDATVEKFASKQMHPSTNPKYISTTSTTITTINYGCENNPPTLIICFCTLFN